MKTGKGHEQSHKRNLSEGPQYLQKGPQFTQFERFISSQDSLPKQTLSKSNLSELQTRKSKAGSRFSFSLRGNLEITAHKNLGLRKLISQQLILLKKKNNNSCQKKSLHKGEKEYEEKSIHGKMFEGKPKETTCISASGESQPNAIQGRLLTPVRGKLYRQYF